MMENSGNPLPFEATIPGDILSAEIEERGIKQKELALMAGIAAPHINELIKGKRPVTAETAMRLEKALGIKSEFWMNLQANYELTKAKNKERDASEKRAVSILETINKIVDVRVICKEYNMQDLPARDILSFFQTTFKIDSVSDLSASFSGLFLKDAGSKINEKAARTWVLIAREKASRTQVSGLFNARHEKEMTKLLARILHRNIDTVATVENILSGYGIRFCIVPELPGAEIDGYAAVIDRTPAVILTGRDGRIDSFAFSLMHELGHVFLHLKNDADSAFLTFYDRTNSREEKAANKFASSYLVSNSLWDKAPETKPVPGEIKKKYSEWAEINGLNKWIVLGRVCQELGIKTFKADSSALLG